MNTEYLTREGDMIDAICHTYYGTDKGTVEAVLEANPQLPKADLMLPVGLLIQLPDIEPSPTKTVKLWD